MSDKDRIPELPRDRGPSTPLSPDPKGPPPGPITDAPSDMEIPNDPRSPSANDD